MRKSSSPFWRGFSVQLFAVIALPLTLLLLAIAFATVTIHQRDMPDRVGERDERAVRRLRLPLNLNCITTWRGFPAWPLSTC
jgi:hypothetical protein